MAEYPAEFVAALRPHIDERWSFGVTVYCPPGWEQIVLDAHAKLVEIDPDYKILQVKEKFGCLRYYTSQSKPEFWEQFVDVIRAAEEASAETCEQCGTKEDVTLGALGGKYNWWIFTLCGKCRTERRGRREAEDAANAAKYGFDDDEEE